jgi:hypothetical protein
MHDNAPTGGLVCKSLPTGGPLKCGGLVSSLFLVAVEIKKKKESVLVTRTFKPNNENNEALCDSTGVRA